jgi:hypothetical protein
MMITKRVIVLMAILLIALNVEAQHKKKERKGEFYFSWGYNKEWYTNSNIRVMQPALGNDYKFMRIEGHDHPGWDEGLFQKPLSVPQYNYRLGYVFDKKRGLGWEINFDHTKFIFADQNAHIVGKLNNRQVDTSIAFNQGNGYYYYLNNGANFLLFNLTKRWHLYQDKQNNLKIDGFLKGGVGPVIPHVQNKLNNIPNAPDSVSHFQLGGWNIGTEATLRATFFKTIYLEYSNKLDFASYSGLRIYDGTVRQSFGTYEMILSLGFTFPMGHREH